MASSRPCGPWRPEEVSDVQLKVRPTMLGWPRSPSASWRTPTRVSIASTLASPRSTRSKTMRGGPPVQGEVSTGRGLTSSSAAARRTSAGSTPSSWAVSSSSASEAPSVRCSAAGACRCSSCRCCSSRARWRMRAASRSFQRGSRSPGSPMGVGCNLAPTGTPTQLGDGLAPCCCVIRDPAKDLDPAQFLGAHDDQIHPRSFERLLQNRTSLSGTNRTSLLCFYTSTSHN